jgi:hypothetical protein
MSVLRSRPPRTQAVTPLCVTDRTCVTIFGVPWTSLRPWLIERGVAIVHIGRRPVVRVDAVLAAIDCNAGVTSQPQLTEDQIVAIAAGRRGT